MLMERLETKIPLESGASLNQTKAKFALLACRRSLSLGLNSMRNVNFIELWLIEKDLARSIRMRTHRLNGGSLLKICFTKP